MIAIREINKLYQEIESAGQVMIGKAIRIGELLDAQKSSMQHGEWIPWVELNLPFNRMQAAKYMRVHANRQVLLNEQSTFHLEDAISSLAKPKAAHVSHNSGENEWYTPPKFIEAAREVMGGIDTDPASSKIANKTVKAKTFYTVENDGVEQEWGQRVWINPPYSQPQITEFCDVLVEKLGTGEVQEACALVNNATETAFGQKLLNICAAVCFPSGRIKFLDKHGDAKGTPLQGQMIVYFGDDADKFCSEFAGFGVCLHE